MKITVFLPCRKGSERVPKKNIKPFGGYEHGLVELKLRQLIKVDEVDAIILSTNDEEIIEFATDFGKEKLLIHRREERLSTSATSTDELVCHALELIPEGHILWTHVTSPFIDSQTYSDIIAKYKYILEGNFDSLMTTSLVHGFLWNNNGPINYDRSIEKWPRTQTIEPVHEVNSGVFLSSAENYLRFNDRVGDRPYFYNLNKLQGFDVDWEDEFEMADILFSGFAVKLCNSGIME